MDLERRLELIALIAQDRAWDSIVFIGQELLDSYYPENMFTGASSPGSQYVVALRHALKQIAQRAKAAR